MPGWVQADPHVLLRLVLGERRARGNGMRGPHRLTSHSDAIHLFAIIGATATIPRQSC